MSNGDIAVSITFDSRDREVPVLRMCNLVGPEVFDSATPTFEAWTMTGPSGNDAGRRGEMAGDAGVECEAV